MQPELLMKSWTGKHRACAKGNFQTNKLSLFKLPKIQSYARGGKDWQVKGNKISKIRPLMTS